MNAFWGGQDQDGNAGFRLYVRKISRTGNLARGLLKQSDIPEEAWYRSVIWAPEIHKINGKWYFTYNCHGIQPNDRNRYNGPHGSGISVADSITGPYKVLAQKPLAPWPSNDLTLFQDDDSKVYAFFNDGFFNMTNYPESLHSIYVAEIDLDRGQLVEDPVKLLTQQKGFESVGIEGAHVVEVGGIYYLFYSGWNGYATAQNVYGPYTRAEGNPLFGARHDGGLIKNGKIIRDIDHPYREKGHREEVWIGGRALSKVKMIGYKSTLGV